MSLILDALNRSRQDSEQVPGLASQHDISMAHPSGEARPIALQWALVAGLAIAVALIGWLLFERTQRPAADGAIAPVSETSEARPKTTAGAVVPEAVVAAVRPQGEVGAKLVAKSDPPQGGGVARESHEVQPRAEPAISNAVKPARSDRSGGGEEAGKKDVAALDPSVAALYAEQSQKTAVPREKSTPRADGVGASPGSSSSEEALDIEALVAKAQLELANAQLEDVGVPFLSSLSQQTKDRIPTLMYQRHDYSGDASNSALVINGKSLKAGSVVSGVKVVEILPDSSVLEFGGTRFRLRALNSWVNL